MSDADNPRKAADTQLLKLPNLHSGSRWVANDHSWHVVNRHGTVVEIDRSAENERDTTLRVRGKSAFVSDVLAVLERAGFICGDPWLCKDCSRFRTYTGAQHEVRATCPHFGKLPVDGIGYCWKFEGKRAA